MNIGPYRYWGKANPQGRAKPPVRAEMPASDTEAGIAVLRLYDPIDSFGDIWGVSAKEFAEVLDGLPKDTSEIRLHINSPGGDVFDAVAICNQLRMHKARVVAVVDGLAASAASFIAASADELVMCKNTSLMIHDAFGVCVGNAADMRVLAGVLDHVSDKIAAIYAAKAGGTRQKWRDVQLAETWFTAEEAVAAGLADRIGDAAGEQPKNAFDLSAFRYGGRDQAPAPLAGSARTTKPKGSRMTDPKPNAAGGRVCGGVPVHDADVVARAWDQTRTVANLDDDLRPSQLRSVYAWVDPDGDPELPGSYAYPHHHGVDGPANLRACVAGIARLNGAAAGPGVPDEDRDAVYGHLAAHVRDAGREPEPLNPQQDGPGGPQLAHHGSHVMAEVQHYIGALSRVVAARNGAGKSLSKVNADIQDWIAEDLARLTALCATPIEGDEPDEAEVHRAFLEGVAHLNALRGGEL